VFYFSFVGINSNILKLSDFSERSKLSEKLIKVIENNSKLEKNNHDKENKIEDLKDKNNNDDISNDNVDENIKKIEKKRRRELFDDIADFTKNLKKFKEPSDSIDGIYPQNDSNNSHISILYGKKLIANMSESITNSVRSFFRFFKCLCNKDVDGRMISFFSKELGGVIHNNNSSSISSALSNNSTKNSSFLQFILLNTSSHFSPLLSAYSVLFLGGTLSPVFSMILFLLHFSNFQD
jgi:Rad3-related DNA helicase